MKPCLTLGSASKGVCYASMRACVQIPKKQVKHCGYTVTHVPVAVALSGKTRADTGREPGLASLALAPVREHDSKK